MRLILPFTMMLAVAAAAETLKEEPTVWALAREMMATPVVGPFKIYHFGFFVIMAVYKTVRQKRRYLA
jgi:hypothetical protein